MKFLLNTFESLLCQLHYSTNKVTSASKVFSVPCQLPRLSRSHIVYEKSTNICRDYNPLTICKDYSCYGWCSSTKNLKLFNLFCLFCLQVFSNFTTVRVLTLLKLTPKIRVALLSKNSEIIISLNIQNLFYDKTV